MYIELSRGFWLAAEIKARGAVLASECCSAGGVSLLVFWMSLCATTIGLAVNPQTPGPAKAAESGPGGTKRKSRQRRERSHRQIRDVTYQPYAG